MRIIKAPFGSGGLGHSEGSKKAPDMILAELETMFLTEDGREHTYSVSEVETDNFNIELSHDNIRKEVMNSLNSDSHAILLGGDHSITYPAFKAFSSKYAGAGLIVFDAHPDVQSDFSPPSHEDYLRMLITEGHLKPENVIIIGMRAWSKEERDFMRQHQIKSYSMEKLSSQGIWECCDLIMETARAWNALYLSIDIDAVDPSMAPGTGYREPGGLTSRELFTFVKRIKRLSNLKMADLVEINPDFDIGGLTIRLGAKVLSELL